MEFNLPMSHVCCVGDVIQEKNNKVWCDIKIYLSLKCTNKDLPDNITMVIIDTMG